MVKYISSQVTQMTNFCFGRHSPNFYAWSQTVKYLGEESKI